MSFEHRNITKDIIRLIVIMVIVVVAAISIAVEDFDKFTGALFSIFTIIGNLIIQWWFFAGMILGGLYLIFPLKDIILKNKGYSNFSNAKGILLAVGSFLAVGGLVTENLDDTIKNEEAEYHSYREINIKSLESSISDMSSYIGSSDCSASSIFASNQEIKNDKEQLHKNNSDKVILCVYSEKYSSTANKIIDMWKAPQILSSLSKKAKNEKTNGAEIFLSEIEKYSVESNQLISLLHNSSDNIPKIEPEKITKISNNIIEEYDQIQHDKTMSKQVSGIKSAIFVGIGMDVVAFLFSGLLLLYLNIFRKESPEKIADSEILKDNSEVNEQAEAIIKDIGNEKP